MSAALPPRPTPDQVEAAITKGFLTYSHRIAVAELLHLRAEVAALREAKDRYEKCFVRIAKAHGIESPLVLISMAENNEENYAEILARFVEKSLSKAPQQQPHPEPPQPRTVREWLETIPCPKWRAAALERVHESNIDLASPSLWAALRCVHIPCNYTGAWTEFRFALRDNTGFPPCPFGKEGA